MSSLNSKPVRVSRLVDLNRKFYKFCAHASTVRSDSDRAAKEAFIAVKTDLLNAIRVINCG